MAVHAHPDDEASSTGGILARYAAEGVRTVLVTCTNGELGDGTEKVKPGEAGHDEAWVVETRRRELEKSCAILGVSDLELLGYHDSGMMGWPQNDDAASFWRTPVADAADRLSALIEKYRPQVLVTYDENGFYGHPDHIQANRVTLAAMSATGIADKLYYAAIAKSGLPRFEAALRKAGVELPEVPDEDEWDFGTPDELIAATIDCRAYAEQKYAALGAHASQADNAFFLRLGPELFAQVFGDESFVRAYDRSGAPIPEHDLFSGVD